MSKRIIGIIGGMGPDATADLYKEIIRLTRARRDQDHLRVMIYSNPKIPDRTRAILGKGENPLPALVETARALEKAGAGVLIMPCNAAHYYLPKMQSRVKIPIFSMIRETCVEVCLENPGIKSVGLLAATGTIISRVYHAEFSSAGVKVLVPDARDQLRIHGAIAQVKSGTRNERTRRIFEAAGARLVKRGAGIVILGCTEIPLAFDSGRVDYETINPTRVLASAAVSWALGKRG
jgi:aspartate racemase